VASGVAAQSKKELVNKVLQLQQPDIEFAVRSVVEQPALQFLQQAAPMIQNNVPADKREAVAKDIQANAKKYAEETYALTRDKGVKAAQAGLAPVLEQKFTEEDLKTLIAWMESPTAKKYRAVQPEMTKAVNDKLVAELRPIIEPKAQALGQSFSKRLTAAASGGAAATAAPATPAAAAAAKK